MNLIDPDGLDPIDPKTGKVNDVLWCHVNPHRDPYENAIGGAALVGVAGTAALGPRIAATTSTVIAAGKRFLYRYGDKLAPWIEFAKGQLENLGQGKPASEDYIGPAWDKYNAATRNNQCKPDYKKTYECHRGY